MTTLERQDATQKSTGLQYNQLGWRQQRWIDVSLQLSTRSKSQIAEECARVYGGASDYWRRLYYKWDNKKAFEAFWDRIYVEQKRKELHKLALDRASDMVGKERDLDKVMNVIETIESREKKDTPTFAVQFNNIVNKEREEFGI